MRSKTPVPSRAPARAALVPVAVAMGVMVVWGATPIVTRYALEDLEPLVVACLRTVIAGLVALPLLRRGLYAMPRSERSRKLLVVSALAGFVIFPVVYTIGQQRTSALHGVMILAVLPVFTGAYAALVARRMPGRAWLIGCAVAIAGEVVLIGGRGAAASDATLLGDLLVVASALVVTAGYVAGAMLPPRGVSAVSATLWGVVLGTVLLGPLVLGLLAFDGVPDAGARSWAAVVFLALVTSIVGYFGWYWALDRGGIHRIATFQFLQPVSGFILAAVVLGEHVTVPIAVGGALIVSGIVVAQRA
jgi:drug/metabolite transporter (DMT)-like permease